MKQKNVRGRFCLPKFILGSTGFLVFSIILVLFQNCSKIQFDASADSQSPLSSTDVNPNIPAPFPQDIPPAPSCQNISQSFQPVLDWDWYSQLNANDYHSFNQVMASPTVADLNGDGHPEVVFVSWSNDNADLFDSNPNLPAYLKNGVLRIVDGKTGSNKVSVGSQEVAPMATTTPLLVDLDNDGKFEIIYMHYTQKKIIALNSDGSFRWKWDLPTTILNSCSQGLSASDLDLNGHAEVIVSNWVLEENEIMQPVLKMTLEQNPTGYTCNAFATVLNPALPKFSIVDPFSVHDDSGHQTFSLGMDYGLMAVGKVRSDIAGNQIIKTTSGHMRIFNGLDGALLTDVNLLALSQYTCPGGSIGGGPASIGDFMGDGTLQIAIATGQYLMIFDGQGKLLTSSRTQDCSSEVTGVTAFDFDGDGKPEILYGDEKYFRVFRVVNNQLSVIAKIVNPSGTLYEYPVVADIDGDGTAKILMISNNYAVSSLYNDPSEASDVPIALTTTGIRAFKSGDGKPWMPTRPLWNQYHYNASLMNDRGRVFDPSVASQSWLGKTFKLNSQITFRKPICKK